MADRAELEDREGKAANATATAEPARVFISYASQDAAVAGNLMEALERHGIACWIAPRDVKPGAKYADAIARAIGGAKALALVLSEHAVASAHVSREIERACSKKHPIFALHIDAAPLTPAFEYFLSESQGIEVQLGHLETVCAKLIDNGASAIWGDPIADGQCNRGARGSGSGPMRRASSRPWPWCNGLGVTGPSLIPQWEPQLTPIAVRSTPRLRGSPVPISKTGDLFER